MTHKEDSAYQPSRWIISFRLLLGFVSLSLLSLLLTEDSDLPVALVVMETHVSGEPARENIQQTLKHVCGFITKVTKGACF